MSRAGGALHWAEAIGLSALVHAGAIYVIMNGVEFSDGFERPERDTPEVIVTSLVLDAGSVDGVNVGQDDLQPIDPDAEMPELAEPEVIEGGDEGETLDPLDTAETLEDLAPEDATTIDESEIVEAEDPEQIEDAYDTDPPLDDYAADIEDNDPISPQEPETVEEIAADETENVTEAEDLAAVDTAESIDPLLNTDDVIEPEFETIVGEEVGLVPETLSPIETLPPEDFAAVSPDLLAEDPISPIRPDDNGPGYAPAPSAGGAAPAPERLTPLDGVSTLAIDPLQLETLTNQSPSSTVIAPASAGAVEAGTSTLTSEGYERLRPLTALPGAPEPPAAEARPGTPGTGGNSGEVSQLVLRIRDELAQDCLVGLPRLTAQGQPELVVVSSDETSIAEFAGRVLVGLTPRPAQLGILVDARQCPALNFVRTNAAYPAFRLGATLDQNTISSGDRLTGAIESVAGRYISLLLIDDNGVVQDLGDYLSFTGNQARFDVPMQRAGNSRDTRQLLLALGTFARPNTLDVQNGQEATVFFEALRAEIDPRTAIVLLPFDVR